MKKLLLSLLIVSLVQDNFAMQSGGAADNTAGENSSSIYQRLITSIKNGNEEDVINELIASGDKASKLINARNKDGSTPLIFASRNGREQIVDLLISNNADVNTRTDDGETALCAAVSSRKCTINLVKQLIAANADLNARKDDDTTALHLAAQGGCTDITQLLIENSADLNAIGKDDLTALHLALIGRQYETARLLINAGADCRDMTEKEKFVCRYPKLSYIWEKGFPILVCYILAMNPTFPEEANLANLLLKFSYPLLYTVVFLFLYSEFSQTSMHEPLLPIAYKNLCKILINSVCKKQN
jgi:hypothetical protein